MNFDFSLWEDRHPKLFRPAKICGERRAGHV